MLLLLSLLSLLLLLLLLLLLSLQGCILEPAASEVRSLLCQVSPATFIASQVQICQGDGPQPSTFHKTPTT